MARMLAATAAAVAALTLMLVGCGATQAGGPVQAGDSSAGATTASAPAATSTPSAHPSSPQACPSVSRISSGIGTSSALPDGFRPVAVVVCEIDQRSFDADREWYVVVQRQAASGIDGLVRLLRHPRDEKTGGPLCAVGYESPPWIALVGADGRWIPRHVPVDGCGFPTRRFNLGVDAARWITVGERRDSPVQSDEELRAEGLGCDHDGFDLSGMGPVLATATGPANVGLDGGTEGVTVCRYTRVADGDLVFESGGPIPPETVAVLVTELAASSQGHRCKARSTRSVMVKGADGTDWVVVELDGCRRVFDPTGTWGQATTGLIDVLG